MSSLNTDHKLELAPELEIEEWINSIPLNLLGLRGNIVVLYFFQMLCPACVIGGSSLAKKIHHSRIPKLKVLGIHSVFEHHEAMRKPSLLAYLHEFHIDFPIGIDQRQEGSPIPRTMEKYHLQGTPSFLIIDPKGYQRAHFFGLPDEFTIGVILGQIIRDG